MVRSRRHGTQHESKPTASISTINLARSSMWKHTCPFLNRQNFRRPSALVDTISSNETPTNMNTENQGLKLSVDFYTAVTSLLPSQSLVVLDGGGGLRALRAPHLTNGWISLVPIIVSLSYHVCFIPYIIWKRLIKHENMKVARKNNLIGTVSTTIE